MLDAIVARKADEILEFNTAHIIVTFAHHNTKVESAQHNLVLLFWNAKYSMCYRRE